MSDVEKCQKPNTFPCNLDQNHEGKCSLSVNFDGVQFSGKKPLFHISNEQSEATSKWITDHEKSHIPPGKTVRYTGAIGGAYTWKITPTSIFNIIVVKCCCGEELDVTDYDF